MAPLPRVIVAGSSGWLGSSVAALLRDHPGLELVCPPRRPATSSPHLDLADPGTFALLDGAAAVINAADPIAAPPLLAARRCLERGPVWIETTAHPPTIEALCDLDPGGARGAVILGAGLFPGVSDLLARRAAAPVELTVDVDLGGGAGRGAIGSMACVLADPRTRASRVALEPGGCRRALRFRSAEGILADRFGAAPITTHLVLRPRALCLAFPLIAAAARRPRLGRVLARLGAAAMRLVRSRLLRNRPGRIALYIGAPGAAARLALTTRDGRAATARAVAFAAHQALARPELRGVVPFPALVGR